MSIRHLKLIILILFPVIVLILGCNSEGNSDERLDQKVTGKTMGTTYSIQFGDVTDYLDFQFEIDSVLIDVNNALSTYIPTSVISRFNQAKDTFEIPKISVSDSLKILNRYFLQNFNKSGQIWRSTNGAFDPTVGPLVNFWGFGTDGRKEIGEVDTAEVELLLELVGFDKIQLVETMAAYLLIKTVPGIELDFSAIAKGFGVDEVGRLLEARGVKDYMVEIGGEVRCRGVNSRGETWRIGINKPDTKANLNAFFAITDVNNESIASSGNYRNFYIKDGVKRFHSIDPLSGFPKENRLRSATIMASDCMTADAFATACMIMGVDKAKSMAYSLDEIKALLIYETESGENDYFATTGIQFQLID